MNHQEVLVMNKTTVVILALLPVLILGLASCGGAAPAEAPSAPTGDAAKGEQLYAATCAACHGPEGKGVQGLGKDMTSSEFIAGKTDEELVEFIQVGRPADDPLNTTGMPMLPKGGNSALTDQDLYDIVAFIRTLQQ
jgi:mono/diheme cytochrome c family protein